MPRTETYDPTSALVLSILLGYLGIDRFYIGHPIRGLLKLLTIGGLGIWWLIDIVLRAGDLRRARRAVRTAPVQPAPAPAPTTSPSATAGERVPPAPAGMAIEPPARTSMMTEVVGEHLRSGAFAHLLEGEPQNGSYLKVERIAALSLDPENPDDPGLAVSVWIQGRHVGFLARQNASRYAPLLTGMAERGQHLSLHAAIAGRYDRRQQRWTVDVSLELPEPELILPGSPPRESGSAGH
ncbi:hypothetical protein GCM10023160_26870 [Brachybacterium paraconglomeratum]|uniref:NINE protein n=1 Tax=Brachybacterium paraconglomeratum TaxID=173362 RepID=UPI0031F0F2BA